MLKRIPNLIVCLFLGMSWFAVSSEIGRKPRVGDSGTKPTNAVCSVRTCDLVGIEKKICCVSNQIDECCEQLEENIIECCNKLEGDITDCCDKLENDITECCNEILTAIDQVGSFDFYISSSQLNTGDTTVLNQEGTYLLVNGNPTITNPPASGILIDITTGCLLIDLGGRCVDASSLVNIIFNVENQQDVTIRNGIILNVLQNAIYINNSNNVVLENLTIENVTGGASILIQNSTNIRMDNVTVLNNGQNGIVIENVTGISLTNSSVAITNVVVTNQIGIDIDPTANVYIDNVKVTNNFYGFQFDNSSDIVINNSIAEKNVSDGYRFIGGSKTISLNNDSAINNGGAGVVTDVASNITFACVHSSENGGNGFTIANTNNALLCNCLTYQNSAADVFIAASSNDITINNGCIDFANIIDNGTNTSIFLLQEEFNATFTAIDALSMKVMDGFAGTFTAIDALSTEVIDGFSGTYTAIDELSGDLTQCCNTLEADITALSTEVINGFSGTYTAIDALSGDLAQCCNSLEADINVLSTEVINGFSGTYTAIDELSGDLNQCCNTLEADINALSTEVTNGFSGTYTAIDALSGDLVQCCNTLETDINALSTEVINGFSGTYTAIDELSIDLVQCCNTLETDINALSTEVMDGFIGTFTAIDALNSDLNQCCNTLETDINALSTEVMDGFTGTFTAINALSDEIATLDSFSACTYFISAADIPFTAVNPGTYCLTEDIYYRSLGAPPQAILITGNDIVLDLQGHSIEQATDGWSNIVIDADRVTVQNGTVLSSKIFVTSTSNNCLLQNLILTFGQGSFFSGSGSGIHVHGSCSVVRDCTISRSDIDGILLTGDGHYVQNCTMIQAEVFRIQSSNTIVDNCRIINSTTDGFIVENCDGVQINNCETTGIFQTAYSVKDTASNVVLFGNSSIGAGDISFRIAITDTTQPGVNEVLDNSTIRLMKNYAEDGVNGANFNYVLVTTYAGPTTVLNDLRAPVGLWVNVGSGGFDRAWGCVDLNRF